MKQLFVGGDLSGIQNFLYNISSKKAALSLRGRSFSLDDYMKNVYKGLGKQLSSQNEIYNGGGKFYFITEDSQENRNKIKEFAKEQSKKIWQEHFGQLAINIAFVEYDNTQENKEVIGSLFSQISEKFKQQKYQKFKDLITEDYDKFFEPISVPEKVQVCDVTGIETEKLENYKELNVLPSVKEQIEIGIKLKADEKNRYEFSGYTNGSYLGVLRMDVDGLGGRFANGFDNWEDYKKFSKRLTDFFERKNLEKLNSFDKEKIDLIYAGGDDIFAVGKWDAVIDFADELHKEVDNNFKDENIHISGGMVIVNDKFPISKAAELSGEAESKAKKNKYKNEKGEELEKNSFTFFNEAVHWEEFEVIKKHKEELLSLININNGMPKSILHQIMYYYELSQQDAQEKKKGNEYKYLWHSVYYLTRFMERYKDKKDKEESDKRIIQFCENLRDKEIRQIDKLKLWAIASRWTELLLKDKDRENNNQ